jgi:4-alpha-glucanotransferase
MHITSLPSPYGIGTMGVEAYRFADFLKQTGQAYWQLLPLGPTGFADSPYQSFSTFAGNPYLIDLDMLYSRGLLEKEEYTSLDWGGDPLAVDYGKVYVNKFHVLRIAARRSKDLEQPGFSAFCEANAWWLDDYAVFMSAKQEHGMREWTLWKENEPLMRHEARAVAEFARQFPGDIYFWKFIQFLFYDQWAGLKSYANSLGVKMIGDIPIYVSADSADVWARRQDFLFEDCEQTCCAGVPPDYFSEEGQLWGNPLYRWDRMKEDGYGWWVSRMRFLSRQYDMIRIDHFRGFESFYAVRRGAENARRGEWIKGPGVQLFDFFRNQLGDFPIIAEDLGFLTEEVHLMRRMTGYPGMKILQFAFDDSESSDYLPHKYDYNCVAYTGTHDNATLCEWFEDADKRECEYAREYCALNGREGYVWGMLRVLYAGVSNLAMAQMQDFLELPGSARMNTPATVGGNWVWRAEKDYAKPQLIKKIWRMVNLYGRRENV